MKNYYVIICLLSLLLLGGCEKDEKLLFRGVARVQMFGDKEIRYDFFYKDQAVYTRDTVYLTVNTIGGPQNYTRHISLEQIKEYDYKFDYDEKGNVKDTIATEYANMAQPGVHYLPFDSEEAQSLLVIKPNEVSARIPIILLRDPSLRKNEMRLCIKLLETEDFQLGETHELSRTIIFSDKLSKPQAWDQIAFGDYSFVKHEFMFQAAEEKIDNDWFKRLSYDQAEKQYFQDKFRNALKAYNEDPKNIALGLSPMREDPENSDSKIIVFP